MGTITKYVCDRCSTEITDQQQIMNSLSNKRITFGNAFGGYDLLCNECNNKLWTQERLRTEQVIERKKSLEHFKELMTV